MLEDSLFPGIPTLDAPSVTIGFFDGLHLGHREILRNCTRSGGEAVAITFRDSPSETLRPESFEGYLYPPGRRLDLLRMAGVTRTALLDFPSVASISAEDFVTALARKMPGARITVGDNFRFGAGNRGDTHFLTSFGGDLGLKVDVVPRATWMGEAVSSSRIRGSVRAGDMESAAVMLGRPYLFESTQIEGDRIGRTIGFPTINLAPGRQVVPSNGVYFTFLADTDLPPQERRLLPSMTYIGRRPTLKGRELRIETNILDLKASEDHFAEGRSVALLFVKRIRGEKTLPNLEELRKTIYNDGYVISMLVPDYRIPAEIAQILLGG